MIVFGNRVVTGTSIGILFKKASEVAHDVISGMNTASPEYHLANNALGRLRTFIETWYSELSQHDLSDEITELKAVEVGYVATLLYTTSVSISSIIATTATMRVLRYRAAPLLAISNALKNAHDRSELFNHPVDRAAEIIRDLMLNITECPFTEYCKAEVTDEEKVTMYLAKVAQKAYTTILVTVPFTNEHVIRKSHMPVWYEYGILMGQIYIEGGLSRDASNDRVIELSRTLYGLTDEQVDTLEWSELSLENIPTDRIYRAHWYGIKKLETGGDVMHYARITEV